jgi:hypothetical protein
MSWRITNTRGKVRFDTGFRALSLVMALWIFFIFGSIHFLHNHSFLPPAFEDESCVQAHVHECHRGIDCCGQDGDQDTAARTDCCGIEIDAGEDYEGNRNLKTRIAPTSGTKAGACPACTFLAAAKSEYTVHVTGINPVLDVCERYSPAIECIEAVNPDRTFDPRAPPPA